MALHHPESRQTTLGFDDVEPMYGPFRRAAPTPFRDPNPDEIFVFETRLSKFLEGQDQGWVIELMEFLRDMDLSGFIASYSSHAGQPPVHPRLMLGLIIFGILEKKHSLRELETLARLNLAAIYVCAGLRPDHSTIGRFLVRHQETLTEEFFVEVTTVLMKKLGRKAGMAAGDGTVVEAAASRFAMAKAEAIKEAAREAQQAAAAAPLDERVQQAAATAAVAAELATERQVARKANKTPGDATLATTEPEAAVLPRKDGAYRPAYKPSVLANEDRMIIGQHLHPSNELQSVAPMLAQHQEILGAPPTTALMDAAFFVGELLRKFVDAGQSVLIPSGRESSPEMEKESKSIGKARFLYDATTDTYLCPRGNLLALARVHDGKEPYRRYQCNECDGCPLRAKCTKSASGRTIKRFPDDDVKEAMREVLKHPLARRDYGRRKAMVEPVFSVLRDRQGLTRFRRKGLRAVRMEFSVHCVAYNIRTALRIAAREGRSCWRFLARVYAAWCLLAALTVRGRDWTHHRAA